MGLLGLLMSAAEACGEEQRVPATAILVSINSDLKPGTQLSRVEVELRDFEAKGPPVETRAFSISADEPEENQVSLPFSFGIARGHEERFRITVRGYGPDSRNRDKLVLQQTLISSFQSQQTLLLKVFLSSLCLDKLCAEGDDVQATCYAESEGDIPAGSCGPIPERTQLDAFPLDADPHAWTHLDAGGMDAGRDGALDGSSDARMDTSVDAPPPQSEAAPPEASPPDAMPEGGPPMPMPVMWSASISNDAYDVNWINEDGHTFEKFRYRDDDDSGKHLEIGNDADPEFIGLRFPLPLAKGALIQSATLTLQRFPITFASFPGNAPATDTMKVQVFDSAQVPGFMHIVEKKHTDRGAIWPPSVNGFALGEPGKLTSSPDLSMLVQHVIDRAEWVPGANVVFLLSGDSLKSGNYADFTDHSYDAANAAKLQLSYLPAAR